MMEIIRKELTPDEVSPPNTRYNSLTNHLQITFDAGATWVNNDGADTRTNLTYLLPPRTGSDIPCNAAANAVGKLEDLLGAVLSAAGVAEGVALALADISGTVFAETGVGVLVDAILSIVDFWFTLGTSSLSAELTSGVYDELKCIFFCHMGPDGSVTASQLASIMSDVNEIIPSLAALAINGVLDMWGFVGLSNAGATGSLTGSCGSCGCVWCYHFDPPDSSFWTIFSPYGTFVSGGVQGVPVGGTAYSVLFGTTFPSRTIHDVTVIYSLTALGGDDVIGLYRYDGSFHSLVTLQSMHAGTHSVTFVVDTPLTNLYVNLNGDTTTPVVVVHEIYIDGIPTQTNPFGTSNCTV